jgi:tetratricopeptide (TPR) repeat protein
MIGSMIRRSRRQLFSFIKRTWRRIRAPFRLFTNFLRWLGRQFVSWWTSRRWRALLWGLPAILIGAACIAWATVAASRDPFSLANRYVAAAQAASDAENWQKAKLCFERAIELGVRSPQTLFDLAITAQRSGDESRKLAVLERIAPDDRAVYAPSHLWRATQLLSAPTVTKEVAALAEKHLRFAVELDPDNQSAHAILGDLYFQAGLWQSAATHLQQIRAVNKDTFRYRLLHSKASAALGDVDAGRKFATEVWRESQPMVASDPANLDVRLIHGEAALLIEKYDVAARVLQEGMQLSDAPELRQSLALVLLHWSDDILDKDPTRREDAFQLLSLALDANPNELLLFDRILELLRRRDDTSTTAEAFLTENLVQGRSAGISHLILGTYYFDRGELETGGKHLEQAFRLLPSGLVVANNYAWYLAKREPPQVDEAMQIINQVIAKDPSGAEFRDTRAHIHMAKRDWQAAVADFEFAFPKLPPNAESHRAIGKAYEELGLTDLGMNHRRMADEIEAVKK